MLIDFQQFWLQKISQKINSQVKQRRKISNTVTSSKRQNNNKSGCASTSGSQRRKSDVLEAGAEPTAHLEAKQNVRMRFMYDLINKKLGEVMLFKA